MGKKSRRGIKKPKEMKTEVERREEMDTIKGKLTGLGLSKEMKGIDEFYERALEFIKSGESWSGKIKVPGSHRILDVILTPYKHKVSTSALLYNKNI